MCFKYRQKLTKFSRRKLTLCCSIYVANLLLLVCKVMESIIRDHVMQYFLDNDFFSSKQYGFLKGRSYGFTVIKDCGWLDKWTLHFDTGGQIDCIHISHASAERAPLAVHGRACGSSWRWLFSSASMAWHRPTSPTTASLCRPWLVDVRCGPPTPEPCTFHGLVLPSAPGTLQWVPPELRMLNCIVCTFAAKLKTFLFSAVSAPENFWSRAI